MAYDRSRLLGAALILAGGVWAFQSGLMGRAKSAVLEPIKLHLLMLNALM